MKYDKKLVIQSSNPTICANGSYSAGWGTFATVYGYIQPLTGRELVQAGAIEAVYTHRIGFRAIPGITHDMRVKFTDGYEGKDRYFPIIHIRNVESKNGEMQLACEERSYG